MVIQLWPQMEGVAAALPICLPLVWRECLLLEQQLAMKNQGLQIGKQQKVSVKQPMDNQNRPIIHHWQLLQIPAKSECVKLVFTVFIITIIITTTTIHHHQSVLPPPSSSSSSSSSSSPSSPSS